MYPSFFGKRITRFADAVSDPVEIDSSIVQGSGLGPPSYADLKTLDSANFLIKYADDTYLLIDSSQLQTAMGEYENISIWARGNNLRLNKSKTLENRRDGNYE